MHICEQKSRRNYVCITHPHKSNIKYDKAVYIVCRAQVMNFIILIQILNKKLFQVSVFTAVIYFSLSIEHILYLE